MAEKDFANMPIEELEAYCEEIQKELDTAQWFLRSRKTTQLEETNKSNNS